MKYNKETLLRYFNENDVIVLIDFCEVQISIYGEDFELLGAIGKAKSELERFDEAIIDLSNAIAINNSYYVGYYNRGLCYYHVDEEGNAIKDFLISELSPSKFEEVDYYIGMCYFNIHDYGNSIIYLSICIGRHNR